LQLNAMSRGEIRKLDEDAPPEIQPLVHEINHLVEMLSQRISRSRNALGNLAHALKAPLTVLNQLINDAEIRRNEKLYKDLHSQLENMRTLMERELKRARLAGSVEPGRRFKLEQDLTALVNMFKTIYQSRQLQFDVDMPDASEIYCPFDREDVMEILGNLLDNACKWAHSRVSLAVTGCTQRFSIKIEDDGPGVPEDKAKDLVNRGARIDEQVEGHGLGLAIVRDAVNYYGGTMEVGNSKSLGGFYVYIELPIVK